MHTKHYQYDSMYTLNYNAVDVTPSKIPAFFTFDFDFGVMVTQNVVEYPPHHVTHGHEKFEVATSNGNGATLKRKHIFLP